MSKNFLRVACAVLCVLLCLPILTSCGNENIYELGPYSINKEEYAYLLSSYKRTAIDELGIDAFDRYVEKLADFIIKNNANVKNHYETILKWHREDSVV